MRICTKLVASSSIAAAGVLALGVLGHFQARAMYASAERLIEDGIMTPLEREITRLSQREEAVRKLHYADRDAYQVLVDEYLILQPGADVAPLAADHAENLDQIRERTDIAFEHAGPAVNARRPAFDQAYTHWRTLTESAVDAATRGDLAAAQSTANERRDAFNAFRAMIDEHSGAIEAEIDSSFGHVTAIRADITALRAEAGNRQLLLGALVAVGGLTVLSILIPTALSISKRLRKMAERMEDVAVGNADLTKRVDTRGNDEIDALGRWFNAVVERFGVIVSQINLAATNVDEATHAIQQLTDSASAEVDDQAKSLSQVSAAITEVSQSVHEVARSTNAASTSAQKSSTLARSGSETVKRTVQGMSAIEEAVSNSSASVAALGERGREIGVITDVINEIADQTNLLALNAAIEAARAGEHGRGFAVVADEVRKLADRTTKATEQISASITSIQSETDRAVARIGEGAEQTRAGAALAAEAGESLDHIEMVTDEVARVMESIAAATEQQSGATGEITQQAMQVADSADAIGESMRSTTREAANLAAASQQLLAIVQPFKTM